MNNIHITTNTGEQFTIPIGDIDKHVNNYPSVWRSSPSPHNYPQNSSNHAAAGSIVGYPYEEVSLDNPLIKKIIETSGTRPNFYLRELPNITYTCITKRDFDPDCHVGKFFNGKPSPHWNFEVKRTIIYDSKSKDERYKIPHKKNTNVPQSEWIDVEIEINGLKFGRNRFFWDEHTNCRNTNNVNDS